MAKKPAVRRPRRPYLLVACVVAAAVGLGALVREAMADSAAAATPFVDAEDLLHQEACRQSAQAIQVEVEGVRSSHGTIVAKLFDDDPEVFLKPDGGIDSAKVPAETGRTALCLIAPQSGDYAIALYHDENGDGRFNRAFLGLPQEGYGFSRNPGFLTRAPRYEEIAFEFDADEVEPAIAITLLYVVE